MAWKTIGCDSLSTFKASWPCHGFPDELYSVSFEFAANGDLVDIEAYDDHGERMDSAEFDGPALVALSQDAKDHGENRR